MANPLQYCLENSAVRGAWWATTHGVAQSRPWLSGEQQQLEESPNPHQILLLQFSRMLIERLASPVLGAEGTLDELQASLCRYFK